ncbi:MAG TPA: SDR family oxidoreductase [Burkholderiales bacterium]|nr:SDR family oxidoreductase [Burkholderiales bacterium]
MEASAKGLRVLVTAGGAGIGRAIAQTFREHGARVHTSDIDPKTRPDTLADVADLGQVEKLFQEVQKNLGGLDVLVNNAGIAGPTGKVEDLKPEDWDRCIAVDLSGMFYCTRKAMPMIKASGGGSIINLSSAAGLHGFPQRSPYCAAKWGVVGFTKSLSVEAGPDKVRVNCICPGIVEGERIERVVEAKAKMLGVSREAFLEKFLETTSMRSTVNAQEIADMALYLASAAGRHITGQALAVDAGTRYLV